MMVLCAGLLVGCDKESDKLEIPEEPSVENPEVSDKPTTPPSTDDIIKTRIGDIDMIIGSNEWRDVIHVDGRYMAIAQSGYVAISKDEGISWTANDITSSGALLAVAYSNGLFIAVGTNNAQTVQGGAYRSTNGEVWTGPYNGGSRLHAITYANGKFVAVGEYGTSVSSTDGITWIYSPINDNNGELSQLYFNGIAYGNGKFITVAASKRYATSSDGKTWTLKIIENVSGGWEYLNAITYANGKFVVVGEEGFISYSTDGETWISKNVGTKNWLSITYGAGKFVAVGTNGYVTTSIDGESWSTPTQIKNESGNVVTAHLNGVCAMP